MKLIKYGIILGVVGLSGAFALGKFKPYIDDFKLFIDANELRYELAEKAISSYILEQSMLEYVPEPLNEYYDVNKHYKSLSKAQQKDVDVLMSALHYEAVGEEIEGIIAVAYTILNRKNSDKFGIYKKVNKVNVFVRRRTFAEIAAHKMTTSKGKVVCQYSYFCDGNSDVVPFTPKYKAIKKIAIYTVLGKLDNLTNVPMYETEVINGKTYLNNYAMPINRYKTLKAKNSLNYATVDVIRSKKDKYFYDLVYGKYKNQTIVNVIGNHAFITAKPSTKLASLL